MKGFFKETFLQYLDLFALKIKELLSVASELENTYQKLHEGRRYTSDTEEMNQPVFSLLMQVSFKSTYVDPNP